METIVKTLDTSRETTKIPTTFIPLAPDKILVDEKIDLLVGLFHIMWEDMPHPKTYRIKLADCVSKEGTYVGSQVEYGFPRRHVVQC